jgi:two-component sensor histidine kinase
MLPDVGRPADYCKLVAASLACHRWQGVSLTELVRREFEPYATGYTEINGPDILLKPEAGQAMATVLHELASNAAKYGALSTKYGRVWIRWDRHLNGHPKISSRVRMAGTRRPPCRMGRANS